MDLSELRSDCSFSELTEFLCRAGADDLLRAGPLLGRRIPELGAELNFDQCSPHHAYDLFTHTAHVTAAVPADPVLRWAALLHDVGKVPAFTRDANGRGHFKGHGPKGAAMAEEILCRLDAPLPLRREAVLLIRLHMERLTPDPGQLRALLDRYGQRFPERLLTLQEADMNSKGTGEHEGSHFFETIRSVLAGLKN